MLSIPQLMVIWVPFSFLLFICLILVGVKGIYYGFNLCLSDYVLYACWPFVFPL